MLLKIKCGTAAASVARPLRVQKTKAAQDHSQPLALLSLNPALTDPQNRASGRPRQQVQSRWAATWQKPPSSMPFDLIANTEDQTLCPRYQGRISRPKRRAALVRVTWIIKTNTAQPVSGSGKPACLLDHNDQLAPS